MKISLCLATYNEESNIQYPLESCIDWVDEVVIVDGGSTDKTVKIAKSYGEKVKIVVKNNPEMFHINKQKALDLAKGEWILQLDADEAVTPELKAEIKKIIVMNQQDLIDYQKNLKNKRIFRLHEKILAGKRNQPQPSGKFYTAFFLPRLNYFLGKFLKWGGIYPDGAIRLIKKGKARFPCQDIHEVMEVDGKIGWLDNPLLHYDSPTFKRYIDRNNRYINMMADDMERNRLPKNLVSWFDFCVYKPFSWLLTTLIRHRGILDGWQGMVFSFFSAIRFPRAYYRYLTGKRRIVSEKVFHE